MDFTRDIQNFADHALVLKDSIETEEATKTALIMPFFRLLGYDVFNPVEFVPEYTADIGIKKGEKVDYAIMQAGKPIILIEAKKVNEPLDANHSSQLLRYFGTVEARFGILTNGLQYQFYTDCDAPNIMDKKPFLDITLADIRENEISELEKFRKDKFEADTVYDAAAQLKDMGQLKKAISGVFAEVPDGFVRVLMDAAEMEGKRTQNAITKYRPLVKKAAAQYINDIVRERLDGIINPPAKDEQIESQDDEKAEEKTSDIVTTEEELQALYIVRAILGGNISVKRIGYKDTASYFNILIDNKVTRWVCRLYFKENLKYVVIPNENENVRYDIQTLEDIYGLSDALKERVLKIAK